MIDFFNSVAAWFAYPQVRAIVIGLVISWNGTQIVKNAPFLVAQLEGRRRFNTRMIAFFLGFVPSALLWAAEFHERVLVGAAVGLAAPTIYTYGARVLYHYFPWIEPKMSASTKLPSAQE